MIRNHLDKQVSRLFDKIKETQEVKEGIEKYPYIGMSQNLLLFDMQNQGLMERSH